jgi:hypothetical protein
VPSETSPGSPAREKGTVKLSSFGGLDTLVAAKPVVTPTLIAKAMATATRGPIQPAAVTLTPNPTMPAMILVGPAGPIPPGAAFDLGVRFSSPVVTRGAQFGLAFDPAKAQVTGIDEGEYYRSWASRNGASSILFPRAQVDAQNGRVSAVGLVILGGTGTAPYGGGPTGAAVLATVHCVAAPGASGSTSVTLEDVVVSESASAGVIVGAPSVQITDAALVVGNAVGAGARVATSTPRLVLQPTLPAAPTAVPVQGQIVTGTAPVFGVVVDRSLRVLDVQRGSSAEAAGVQRNDVIRSIDGVSVALSSDAKRIFWQSGTGKRLTIIVRRGAQDLAFSVVVAIPIYTPGQPNTPTPVLPTMDFF